jgi:hypothetical protein
MGATKSKCGLCLDENFLKTPTNNKILEFLGGKEGNIFKYEDLYIYNFLTLRSKKN